MSYETVQIVDKGSTLGTTRKAKVNIGGSLQVSPTSGRNAGVLHRSAIATLDKVATPGTLTVTDAGVGGVLANVAYNVAVSAFNRWGNTLVATGAVTPTASHRVSIAFATVTGADGYDIFLSTGANPLWVGRITEAQRVTGILLDTVGTTTAGATAGAVWVGVVGTGLASNVAPFAANNAYTPATPTAVNCAGYQRAHIQVKLAVTDLRSLPSLVLSVWLTSQVSTADWFWKQNTTISILGAVAQPLEQEFEVDVDGSSGLVVLVESIAGQGAAASVWVELA